MSNTPNRALLRAATSRRTARTAVAQIRDVMELYRMGKDWYNDKTWWSVSITSSDRLYDVAHNWFLHEDADAAPPRALKATYPNTGKSRHFDDLLGSWVPDTAPTQVTLYYDEHGQRTATIAGHKVTVELSTNDAPFAQEQQGYRAPSQEVITFHARSKAGQQAVVSMLNRLLADEDRRRPALHLLTTYGEWAKRNDLPQRQLGSVVLAEGQMERIYGDLTSFLDAEPEYVRRGVPYHRGYLLYGPPGTGKTSIVRALAAELGLDLWYAPLGDLNKDASLLTLINQVRSKSILLLEDVDVFAASRKRDDDGAGLSMAGLLNALDGVATPHGLITIMTTNDRSVIDDAVVRPGRIDVVEYIGLPDRAQLARLYESWYETPLSSDQVDGITFTGTTAAATEVFKRHLNDPVAALADLQAPAVAADDVLVGATTTRE